MAKILIFNNFAKKNDKSILAYSKSNINQYYTASPGIWQANPYSQKKHMTFGDITKRFMSSFVLWLKSFRYDVLIVDSATTAIFLGLFLTILKGKTKIIVASFNVPRHRKGKWQTIGKKIFSKLDYVFVHSRHDIELCKRLYGFQTSQIGFRPFVRPFPTTGKLNCISQNDSPYILSMGSNGRDYKTFMKAIENLDIKAIVVAKEHNLLGINIPKNVLVLKDLELAECDKLVENCLFTVFTVDGSEPSCGQISYVTSSLLGKPIICTNFEGAWDYVSDNQNGLYVEMNNPDDLKEKISLLYNNKELYQKLSIGAKDWSNVFAIEDAAQLLIENTVNKIIEPIHN